MAYNNNYNIRIAEKLKQFMMDSIQNEKNNFVYSQTSKMGYVPDHTLEGKGNTNNNETELNYENEAVSGTFEINSTTKYAGDTLSGSGGYNINPATFRDTGFGSTLGMVQDMKNQMKKKVGGKNYVKGGKKKENKKEEKKEEHIKLEKAEIKGGVKLGRVVGGKRGRPSKMKGGTELGLPINFFSEESKDVKEIKKRKLLKAKEEKAKEEEINKESKSEELPSEDIKIGNGKSKSKSKKTVGGRKLVDKAQLKGVQVNGGSKKVKRSEIVKKIMKEHNLKMIDASKYVKEHNLY